MGNTAGDPTGNSASLDDILGLLEDSKDSEEEEETHESQKSTVKFRDDDPRIPENLRGKEVTQEMLDTMIDGYGKLKKDHDDKSRALADVTRQIEGTKKTDGSTTTTDPSKTTVAPTGNSIDDAANLALGMKLDSMESSEFVVKKYRKEIEDALRGIPIEHRLKPEALEQVIGYVYGVHRKEIREIEEKERQDASKTKGPDVVGSTRASGTTDTSSPKIPQSVKDLPPHKRQALLDSFGSEEALKKTLGFKKEGE